MPALTADQVKKRQQKLKATLAEAGETLDAAKRRALHKKVKRAQRKGRKMQVSSDRRAAEKAKGEAAPAES